MESIWTIIIGLVIFIVLFLLARELNMWYWKINERISLMQEQNNLLKEFIRGSKSPEKGEVESIITMPTKKVNSHIAPEIKYQNKTNEKSFLKGDYEKIYLEFEDGIKGDIFYIQTKKSYYFKENRSLSNFMHYYDTLENCINALHYFQTTNKILKEGFSGTYS